MISPAPLQGPSLDLFPSVLDLLRTPKVDIGWFAILFTGQYPKSLFDYNVGVARWWLQVSAYAFLLVTGEYPPFSLN
jgi:hypothetical protein